MRLAGAMPLSQRMQQLYQRAGRVAVCDPLACPRTVVPEKLAQLDSAEQTIYHDLVARLGGVSE